MRNFILIIILFFIGCKKTETAPIKQFFIVSIENGIMCSIKGNLNDTLYFENKRSNEVAHYSYCILNKQEKLKLKKMLESYSRQKPLENFEAKKEETIIILKSDKLEYYQVDWPSENGKTMLILINDVQYKTRKIDVKRFWNTEGFVPAIYKEKLINTINSKRL
ncbi:MAG: hypothetical protein H7199_00375 [Burkholderiales bacterium]|nr:hypothetical protein [Flavobacterium sp.]